MTDDMYGYEAVEENESTGRYLTMKKKGDKIKIRLATPPRHVFRYWETGPDGKNRIGGEFPTKEACRAELEAKYPNSSERPKIDVQYGWIVIDRTDEGVKVFKSGQQIASSILNIAKEQVDNVEDKSLIVTLKNGTQLVDPTAIDFVIVRTEENPYYSVTPVMKAPTALTEAEKKMVKDSGINLEDEMESGSASKSHDADTYGGAVELETLPAEEPKEETPEVDVEADDDSDLPF